MAQCKNHPDREAVATCSVCGAPICAECIAPGGEEPVCFDCSIAMAEKDLGREKAVEATATPPPAAPARRGFSTATKVLVAVGLLVILGELAIILFMGPVPPKATGTRPPLDPAKAATLDAVTRTIVVTQQLEAYKRAHGHYPAGLSEIASSLPGPLRATLDDPSTRYSVDENGTYHLELKADAKRPVVAGANLKAPVLKPEAPEGGTP